VDVEQLGQLVANTLEIYQKIGGVDGGSGSQTYAQDTVWTVWTSTDSSCMLSSWGSWWLTHWRSITRQVGSLVAQLLQTRALVAVLPLQLHQAMGLVVKASVLFLSPSPQHVASCMCQKRRLFTWPTCGMHNLWCCIFPHTCAHTALLAGSLGGAEKAAAMAAAAAEGMPAPLRPTKELYQEKSLNLADAWARVYLARGCGAVVHSRVGGYQLYGSVFCVLLGADVFACQLFGE
jgi:hypothetical protein